MQPQTASPASSPRVGAKVRRVIAIGASAGGLHSLFAVLTPIPAGIAACIAVATHLSATHNSVLPELLARRTALHVHPAQDEKLLEGTVFVARPGFHLTIANGHVKLLDTPPVHFLRPNIDLLFESVAAGFGPLAIGVVLSGTGNDGARGISAIKAAGGVTLTEEPTEAEFNDMPLAAIRTGDIDFILPLDKIGAKLTELCSL